MCHCIPILAIRPLTRGLHNLWKRVYWIVTDRQTYIWTWRLYDQPGENIVFSENPLLSKVPPCTIILVQDSFFNLTIWKPTAPAFQNTLTFDQYLFNSRSNFHLNLVHWNSLHPKRAILPTFSGQTPHFLGENLKTRTNNLNHRKAGSVAVILSLRVGVQHKQTVVQ